MVRINQKSRNLCFRRTCPVVQVSAFLVDSHRASFLKNCQPDFDPIQFICLLSVLFDVFGIECHNDCESDFIKSNQTKLNQRLLKPRTEHSDVSQNVCIISQNSSVQTELIEQELICIMDVIYFQSTVFLTAMLKHRQLF